MGGGHEAGEPDSEAHLRRGLEFVVREWCRSQGRSLAELVCKTVVGQKHPGHAPLVCRGEDIGASLEALGAEDLDLVEGFFLGLADAVADAVTDASNDFINKSLQKDPAGVRLYSALYAPPLLFSLGHTPKTPENKKMH